MGSEYSNIEVEVFEPSKQTSQVNAFGEAIITIILLVSVVGWVGNIVQIAMALTDPLTGLFLVKCIGVFLAPLGVLLGWIGFF
jgi:hypothetical protein